MYVAYPPNASTLLYSFFPVEGWYGEKAPSVLLALADHLSVWEGAPSFRIGGALNSFRMRSPPHAGHTIPSVVVFNDMSIQTVMGPVAIGACFRPVIFSPDQFGNNRVDGFTVSLLVVSPADGGLRVTNAVGTYPPPASSTMVNRHVPTVPGLPSAPVGLTAMGYSLHYMLYDDSVGFRSLPSEPCGWGVFSLDGSGYSSCLCQHHWKIQVAMCLRTNIPPVVLLRGVAEVIPLPTTFDYPRDFGPDFADAEKYLGNPDPFGTPPVDVLRGAIVGNGWLKRQSWSGLTWLISHDVVFNATPWTASSMTAEDSIPSRDRSVVIDLSELLLRRGPR